jgi:hypothetical protein
MAVTTCDKCVKYWITERTLGTCPGCGGHARTATPGQAAAHVLNERRQKGSLGGESSQAADAKARRRPPE